MDCLLQETQQTGTWLSPLCVRREVGDKASYIGSHTVMKSKQPEVRSLMSAAGSHQVHSSYAIWLAVCVCQAQQAVSCACRAT